MRRILFLLLLPALLYAAGVTINETNTDTIDKIVFAWTSDSTGTVTGTTTARYTGSVGRVIFDPGTVAPSDNYDVAIYDQNSYDILKSRGYNKDSLTTSQIDSMFSAVANSKLMLVVVNAGDSTSGVVTLYIIPTTSDESVTSVDDTTGLNTLGKLYYYTGDSTLYIGTGTGLSQIANKEYVDDKVIADSAHIANNAVTSETIVDLQVKTADLAANAVDSSKIAPSAVRSTDIGNQQVKTINIDSTGRYPRHLEGFIGPNNAIKYDRKGNANIMVWIPRFNWDKTNGFNSTVVHPAFVVNGVTKSGFWVSKYENVLIDSSTKAIYSSGNVTGTTHSYIASSQPGKSARYNIDFDAARRSCTNMNNFTTITGWHLMSNAEWAAVALWAKENSTVPCGNSNYGRDNTYKHISGTIIPGDTFGSGSSRWLGGSGGVNTSHNQQESGIYDLTGNISEWVDGIMIVDGLIYVAGDKNTSPTWSGNSFAAIEANWYSTGIYVNWDGAATSFSLSAVNRGTAMSTYKSQYFGTTVGADSLLNALAIGPTISDAAVYGNDAFYANNNGSFFVFRSGTWNGGNSGSGVFFIDARYLDSQVSPTIGFRASLIE